MNGTVIFGAIAMFFIVSGLVTFVNDLHDDVDKRSSYHETKESNYYSYNSIGEKMIVLTELSEANKMKVWKDSSLKVEMMEYFPDFSLMSELVKERMVDNSKFKQRLLKKIEVTEENYIAGVLTGQSAKASLSTF